jgi:DNA-binding PadR family transcriptional regulator
MAKSGAKKRWRLREAILGRPYPVCSLRKLTLPKPALFPPRRQPLKNSGFFPLDIHSLTMYCIAMITKELVAASTEPLILSLLSGGESYGYALIQEVKRLSGDKIEWADGMLYPVLHRMENQGWIASRWGEAENGRKRKYYSLKKDGKKVLNDQREQWLAVSKVFKQLWKEQYV